MTDNEDELTELAPKNSSSYFVSFWTYVQILSDFRVIKCDSFKMASFISPSAAV